MELKTNVLYYGDNLDYKRALVSVKGGAIGPDMVRDLKGVLEREKEHIGVFLTLRPPTAEMRTEAAAAGFYHNEFWKKSYPRIQILTVEEILSGKRPDLPPKTRAYAEAPLEREQAQQGGLGLT